MTRRLITLTQTILLAMVTILASQFDTTSANPAKTVTLNYDGWGWTTTTNSRDVAELLIGYFDTYDKLVVEPTPETKITNDMTITVHDLAARPMNPTVAKNYQSTKVPPTAPPKPKAATARPTKIDSGLATWYRFGDKLTAASRKYPKGTKLQVVAVNSGKSVEVVINDYGPSALTGIDLDLNEPAFAAIAPLGAGKIKVKYYKL